MKPIEPKIEYFDECGQSGKFKTLFKGLSKTAKTYIMGTYPKPFFIDTDHSLNGLPDKHIPKASFFMSDVLKGTSSVYPSICQLLRHLRDKTGPFEKQFPDIQTLAFDGITTLADLLLSEAMLNPHVGRVRRDPTKEKATFDEYGVLKGQLTALFTIIDDLDLYICASTGITVDTEETQGFSAGMPDIVGSTRKDIEHRFDAVIYTTAKGRKYYAHCVPPSIKFPCGIRGWKGPEEIENPTFEKIFDADNFLN